MTTIDSRKAASMLSSCTTGLDLKPMWPDAEKGDLVHHAMVLYVNVGKTVAIARVNGLAWRRAMETLNALACCRGTDIHANPRFWREQLVVLGIGGSGVAKSSYYPFDEDLLTRYRLNLPLEVNTEQVASALTVSLSMNPASDAHRVREEVLATLQPYLTRVPPPLQLELVVEGPRCYEATWPKLKRMLSDLSSLWQLEEAGPFPQKVAVVIEHVVTPFQDGRRFADLRDALSLPCVDLLELNVHVSSSDFDVLSNEISLLMHRLACVDTLRKLSLSFIKRDERCIAAICSALPSMRSLRSLRLEFCDLSARNVGTKDEHDMLYGWLAFALLERKSRGLPLALEIQVFQGVRAGLERALSSPNCLVKFVPLAVEDPVFAIHGSSALLCSGASVTTKPHLEIDTTITPTSIVVTDATRVTVIAQSGDKAIVVWPGVGLVWVRMCDLSNWKTRMPPALRQLTKLSLVDTLWLVAASYGALDELLELIGHGLSALLLPRHMLVYDLRELLSRCPQLKTLVALYHIRVDVLLEYYASGTCKISTLVFNPRPHCGTTTRVLAELFGCLADPAHPVATTLKKLTLEDSVLREPDLRIVADAVRRNRRLQFVSVKVGRTRGDLNHRILGELVDEPVVQTDRSSRALYTFLLAARRLAILRSAPDPCVQLIAQFAVTPTLRCVAW